MVTGRFVSEHWRQCNTMQWHNTAHVVQGKVIVAGPWNNGPSSYRRARIDPDMINHFRSPLFHKQTDHNIIKKIEVNQEEMIRKLEDVVTFTLYPQPSTTHTHIHWNSEQPKIWSNSNKKMCATNLVLDSLHFFGFPPPVYFCLLQSTLNLFHLEYVSFFNSPFLIINHASRPVLCKALNQNHILNHHIISNLLLRSVQGFQPSSYSQHIGWQNLLDESQKQKQNKPTCSCVLCKATSRFSFSSLLQPHALQASSP